jgi:lipoprotein-anchoring transpeptidase ErfK/SrfK
MNLCPRRALLATPLAAGLALLSFTGTASAQGYWFGDGWSYPGQWAKRYPARPRAVPRSLDDRPARQAPKQRDAETKNKDKSERAPTGPLFAVISLSGQHITVYDADGPVARSRVSTGMAGHRTPTGVFSIIGRERYHTSNIYSGAPMPFMQRLTWSGIALHLGVVPNYPASHGCVRLPSAFAQELWGMTKIGERVVIVQDEAHPVDFSHPLLPTPKMQPPPGIASAGGLPRDAAANTALTQIATASNEVPATALTAPVPGPKLLNPIEYARELKVKAAADAADAAKAAKSAAETASVKAAAARRASADLRAVLIARKQAEAKVAAKAKAIDAAKTVEATEIAETAKADAEAELASISRKVEDASEAEAAAQADALAAQRAWREATAAVGAAEQTGKEAGRRIASISILISRKSQKVYVRQGLRPVLDAPATIRDPDAPIGTHLFIASGVKADGATLTWSAITVPSSNSAESSDSERRSRKSGRDDKDAKRDVPLAPSTAAQALERVEIPADVKAQIAELLWLGSSLIISDRPLSGETSDVGTDIVVTTR